MILQLVAYIPLKHTHKMILRHNHSSSITIVVAVTATIIAVTVATSEMYLTCHRPTSSTSKTTLLRSPKYLRMQEKVARNVPCDLVSQGGYCNLPGDHYPWHSVRRFVSENQGLIRRMYGEVRQLSVLRMEIEDDIMSNSIEQSDTEQQQQRSNEAIEIVAAANPAINNAAAASSSSQDDADAEAATTTADGSQSQDEDVPTTTTAAAAFEDEQVVLQEVATEHTTFLENPQQQTTETINNSSTTTTEEQPPSSSSPPLSAEEELAPQVVVAASAPSAASSSGDALRRNAAAAAATGPSSPQQQLHFAEEPTKQQQLKAVNACPVKEEVVAPYWANNTRGEILALLNLYPFEQYIHYEKCNNEFKQMFCRDGCRCEQQYRLHRLLAFDPTNECRGIFSDWFRFPSCCVCKCYLNEEQLASHYRSDISIPAAASSRSPRKIHQDNNSDDDDDLFEEDEFDFYEDQPDVDGVAVPQQPPPNSFLYHHSNNLQMPRR